VVLALLAGGVFFWRANVSPKRAELARLTKQAQKLEPQSKESVAFGKLVKDISTFTESETVWVDELQRLVAVLPESKAVYLTQLSLKDPGNLRFKLVANDNQVANKIATKLSELKTEQGRLRYIARPGSTRRGKDAGYPFNTEVSVEPYREETGKEKRRR
jgi:Tfp pilus assembly protein PilN